MPERQRMISRFGFGLHLRVLALLALLVVVWPWRPLAAQASRLDNSDQGQISGRVIDAQTLTPLGGVVVQLVRGTSATAFRSVVTDSTGAYRFQQLPAGRYALYVERIGYLPRAIEINLAPGDQPVVGFGLEFQPVLLPPLEVSSRPPQPFIRDGWSEPEPGDARVEVARMRQERFLAGDVRVLTRADLEETVTLGESDLFRALQRTPGVSTRDDYTATLWTRGATWDQTRVFLDGLPLYNPTHAGWLFAAVNPDAIGSVAFFPGYRSARWGEGAAAVLDLRTRAGEGEGISGMGEISAASARLALDGELGGGAVRWMAAGRRTYVDLLTALAERVADRDDLAVPYDFSDLIGRVDVQLGRGWAVEASGIAEWDVLRGDVPGLLRGNTGRWGNLSGRLTLATPVTRLPLPWLGATGPVQAQLTYGETRFGTAIAADSARPSAATLPGLENAIRHRALELDFRPAKGDPRRWGWGIGLVRDRVSYDGPLSLLGVLGSVGETRDEYSEATFQRDEPLTYAGVWAERRFALTPRLTLESGLRAEVGDSVHNGGRVRWAPRVAARYALSGTTLASAAWARAYQYTQDVAPAAGPIGPQLHLSAVWVIASAERAFPAARADVATLGVEHWLDDRWLVGATLFRRHATGLQIPNPDTGAVFAGRNPNALASNSAVGADLSVHRLAGRWTATASYSFGRSSVSSTPLSFDGAAYRFPSSADIRHAVDATGAVRLGRGWRLVGSAALGSGVPFTRVVLPDTAAAGAPGAAQQRPRVEAPNAHRTTMYASVDLAVDYTTRIGGWNVNAFVQLRNVLDRDNRLTYLGSRQCGTAARLAALAAPAPDCVGVQQGIEDSFESGLPRLPLVGVRIAF